jgi:uncharacterized membrane protein
MTNYVLLFIGFSFFGWCVDTAYRSLLEKRYTSGTLLPFITPLYGVGGTALVLFYEHVQLPLILQVLCGGALITLVEFLGGVFCVAVLRRRLWDYSRNRWNLLGHTDARHACYWLLAAAVVRALLPLLTGS